MAREIPSYISQMQLGSMPQAQFTDAGANATRKVSAEMGAIAGDIQDKNYKIEKLATTTALRENLHRIAAESGSDVGKLKANLEGFKKQFIAGISDGDIRTEMDITYNLEAMPFVQRATEQYTKNLESEYELSLVKSQQQNITSLSTLVPNLLSEVPETKQSAHDAVANIMKQSAEIATAKRSDGSFYFTPEQQLRMAVDGQKTMLGALPIEKQIEVLGGSKGGFEAVMASNILPSEVDPKNPDKVHGDGDGTLAYRGINSGANKEEFAKIQALLSAGKNKEARALADNIYKVKYWDAINGDALPVNVQGIIMDAAVNQGVGYAKELVKKVEKGATPSQLIEMRRERYSKTKGTPQEKLSWERRLAGFEHLTVAENLNFLDENERKKTLEEAVSRFKSEEERQQILRVVDVASKDKDIYSKFVGNSPNILQEIEDYRVNGGDPEMANYMRKSALTRNALGAGEQDIIYSNIIDEIGQLDIKTENSKVKIGNKDANLETVIRLQQKIMKASIQGVADLDSQLKKLSPVILELAKKERGKDDLGLLWNDPDEPFDNGYGHIQAYLEKQGKEEDYATKASLIRDFIEKADAIPAEIKKDEALFNQAQEEIARTVIARDAGKGMKNVPLPAITRLIANPAEAPQFDELFGAGSAARILGKK